MEYGFLIGAFFMFFAFFIWLIILTASISKSQKKINTLQVCVKNAYDILQKQANLIHEQNEILLNLATDYKNTIKRSIKPKDDEIIYFDEMTLKKNPAPKKPHQSHTQKRDSKGRFTK